MLALVLLTTLALGWGLTELLDDGDSDAETDAAGQILELGDEQFDYRVGDAGDDIISGTAEKDFVAAGAGDDRVFGGAEDDDIFGEPGDDFLRGGDGDDYVLGGTGNDTIYGDAGDDILSSADFFEDDTYLASVAAGGLTVVNIDNDLEMGEADTVFGGAGDDVLFVGGNDVATTGSGADVVSTGLWIDAGEAAIVTDFQPGTDRLAYNYDQNAPVPAVSFGETANGDAVVRINGAVVMVLEGVDFETLSASDVQLFAA